ncbi:MAG TPA: hypothetical protein VMT56_00265 [Candidatus Bathyarchaeia archaeon]|nr:hypothetical protein [Candidatus Bathyarchaeia archaeon]
MIDWGCEVWVGKREVSGPTVSIMMDGEAVEHGVKENPAAFARVLDLYMATARRHLVNIIEEHTGVRIP